MPGDSADDGSTPPATTPVTSRHELRRRQTRHKLLSAAARVFLEKGLHGASLEEICATAGLTRGAFYSNFRSKEELLYAVLSATRANAAEEIRAHGEAAEDASGVLDDDRLFDFGGPERFRNIFLLHLEAVLHGAHHPEYRAQSQAVKSAHIDAIEEVIRQLEAKGAGRLRMPIREAAELCVALVDGLTQLGLVFDDVRYAERVPEAMLLLGPVLFEKNRQPKE